MPILSGISLTIITGFMLSQKALFIYSYDFYVKDIHLPALKVYKNLLRVSHIFIIINIM
jgi:hypothetical protein